jgi:hypothetical protein
VGQAAGWDRGVLNQQLRHVVISCAAGITGVCWDAVELVCSVYSYHTSDVIPGCVIAKLNLSIFVSPMLCATCSCRR